MTSDNAIQTVHGIDALLDVTLQTLDSVASRRIYDQTYRAWKGYCDEQGLNPLEMTPARVLGFIGRGDTTKTTRQRQLSAMRKLAQVAYILDPNDTTRRLYEALKVVKAPTPATRKNERIKHVLTPAQADKVMRQWCDDTPACKRNRALVAVLLLSGIRRSEAAALLWSDVDFENGVLHIQHGKGDKSRDVPLAGDFALDALREWQMCQPAGYVNVFTPVERGGSVGADHQITGTDVYRVVKKTEDSSSVTFSPHDARRTFITEALATNTPTPTVQKIAGHSRGDTTLRYAEGVDARRARKELKFRYG